jgi:hypothetical protein
MHKLMLHVADLCSGWSFELTSASISPTCAPDTFSSLLFYQMLQGVEALGGTLDFSVRNVAAMRTRLSRVSGRDQNSAVKIALVPGSVAQLPGGSNDMPSSDAMPAALPGDSSNHLVARTKPAMPRSNSHCL